MKRYKLLKNDTIKVNEVTLFRIKALKDFYTVRKGDLGGYIQSESNLSQADNARVFGNARVYGNAKVSGYAKVYGDAKVSGYAKVFGDAWVYGDAWVFGNARVGKRSECVNITCLPFNVTITKNHTRIGCQQLLHEDWFNITEDEAEEMGLDKKYFAMFITMLTALIGYVTEEYDI
jgi:hypothetical protein